MRKMELTREQLEQLAKLAAMPDDEIDLVDIPEAPAENWQYARRGKRRLPHPDAPKVVPTSEQS